MIYNNVDVRRPIIEMNEVTALVHMDGQKTYGVLIWSSSTTICLECDESS